MLTMMLALALSAQDEAAARAAIEKFGKEYKARDVKARAAAVTEMAKTQHPKVHDKLGLLVKADGKEVRIAAAQGLGNATDNLQKVAGHLANGIAPNASELSVAVAIAQALEKIQEGLGVSTIKALFTNLNTPVAKVAVETAGELQKKDFIEPLIALLKWLETNTRLATNIGGGKTVTGGGLPGVGGGAGDPDAPKREKALKPVIHKVLEALTRQNFKTTKEWEEWWKKNKENP